MTLRKHEDQKFTMIVDEEIRDEVRGLLQEASTKYILPFYKNLSVDQIDTKSSADDFVTVADRQSEVFLSKKLMELIKSSTVTGEEACSDDKDNLSGLRNRINKSGVNVLTVSPGFVYTSMTKNLDLPNLLTSQPSAVARKIFYSKKKNSVMTPFPWNIIMLIIRIIPEKLFIRIKL